MNLLYASDNSNLLKFIQDPATLTPKEIRSFPTGKLEHISHLVLVLLLLTLSR